MRLGKDHQKKIPIFPLHQPLHRLCFLRDASQEALVKSMKIGWRGHANLAVILGGIPSKSFFQFPFQRVWSDSRLPKMRPAPPIDDLTSVKSLKRTGQECIHDDAALALIAQELPEKRKRTPI